MTNYICSRCKLEKDVSLFYKSKNRKSGRHSECKECTALDRKKYRDSGRLSIVRNTWFSNNPDAYKTVLANNRKCSYTRRHRVLSFYSNGTPKCKCCGEHRYSFLAIDHINDPEKGIARSGMDLLLWLIRNNMPSGFRVLCHNCNLGRSFNNGICPHELENVNVA